MQIVLGSMTTKSRGESPFFYSLYISGIILYFFFSLLHICLKYVIHYVYNRPSCKTVCENIHFS